MRDLGTGRDQPITTVPGATLTDLVHGVDWARDGTVTVVTSLTTVVTLRLPTAPAPAIPAATASPATDSEGRAAR